MRLSLENPLWTFSLVVYAEPGVREECLALQERHALDVNVLLLCAYAGVRGVTLSANEIEAALGAVAAWHGEVVRPLRQARRALKPIALDEAAALRTEMQRVELTSEQIEQAMLWSWWQDRQGPDDPSTAAPANLARLLTHYGNRDPAAAAPNLSQAALRYSAKN